MPCDGMASCPGCTPPLPNSSSDRLNPVTQKGVSHVKQMDGMDHKFKYIN